MIEVELSDGSIAEFPDGTPPDVMKQALQKRFGTPQQPQSSEMTQGLAEMSAMTQNPSRAKFDALPTWQKPIVAASDIGKLASQGAAGMFGLNLDKGAAWLRSSLGAGSYEDELAEQQRMTNAAKRRSGSAGTGAEIVGAVAGVSGAARKGLTLAGRLGTGAMTGKKGLAARSLMMAPEGAAYGAANAFANDQDIGTGATIGLAGGVGGNVVGEGLSAGVGKVAGMFNKKPAPPMGQAKLDANKNAAYDLAERAGVIIKPQGMKSLQDNMIADISDFGYDEVAHPGAKILVTRIAKEQGNNVTLKGLDTIRKLAGNVGYIPGNKPNNAIVSKIVKHIEDLEQSGDTALIEGIDTAVGQKAIKIARMYAHRSFKMEKANNLILKGNQMADRNITDTRVKSVKSQLGKINDPFSSWGRGFTAAEKEAAAKASRYTPSQRALHNASVLNPLGGGKLSGAGHLLTAGGLIATGNLPGLALQGAGALAGVGFQKAGEALANKSVREFVDLVARGGVPAPVVQNALQRLAKSKREAVSRALMAMSVHQGNRRGNTPSHEAQP